MKRKTIRIRLTALLTALSLFLLFVLASCGNSPTDKDGEDTGGDTSSDDGIVDPGTEETPVDTERHDYAFVSKAGDTYTYSDGENTVAMTIVCEEGTKDAVEVEGNTVTLSGFTADSVYTFSGTLYGNIVVEGAEAYAVELVFSDFSLTSYDDCPLSVSGCDKVTLTAKKETENFLYDLRDFVSGEETSAAVFADCDLTLGGRGELTVVSQNNNGVHTKDDLKVKNLTLKVECEDNALKGNDSVSVTSGNITLIARTGDGIKTKNTDLSAKGKQRGGVSITGGTLLIYAACDGIDAAYDVTIDERDASVSMTVFTDRYSPYSEEVTATDGEVYYIRYRSDTYVYSILYTAEGKEDLWKNSETAKSVGNFLYYPIEKPSGYTKMQLFVYESKEEQGQSETYIAASDTMSINESYDTIALSSAGGSLRLSFTNYDTTTPGGFGGMGGGNDGNTEKGDHSTKGIKAGNAVTISSGTVSIKSYDDAIHADAGTTLENGETSVGGVTVSGGTLTLFSKDDAIHGDGDVTLAGGSVRVTGSYEGIEGNTVTLSGGNVSVISDDDGINATCTAGTGILLSGGTLYVLAGGDGLDSNSRTSYAGISFAGTDAVIVSTGQADSAIDTERGYSYTGGRILAVGRSGGMSGESMNSSPSFSAVGKSANLSLSIGAYLTVSGVVTLKMPVAQNASVLYLGSSSVRIASATSSDATFDADGVAWD